MPINYRLLAVDTKTGNLYDIAEFENLADVDNHARAIKSQWHEKIHVFVVDVESGNVMGRIYEN
jgi:hypothetical protein